MSNILGLDTKQRTTSIKTTSPNFFVSATGTAGGGGVPRYMKSIKSYTAKCRVAATASPIDSVKKNDIITTKATTKAVAEAGAVEVNTTCKSVISSLTRANKVNRSTNENYYLLHWLYRIRKTSCARGLRIWFLQPDFLCIIYGPMMHSAKHLRRTDADIRAAVDLWCSYINRAEAEEQYGHISDWDVSSVTDMSRLFSKQPMFNYDISRWDVSNVTNMSHMFDFAYEFDQAVGDWDVSKVTNMSYMFYDAQCFDQPVGDWDVSNVTNMNCMFRNAQSFDQAIGDWDVSNVSNMSRMFHDAREFNQAIGDWDVSKVSNMYRMFYNAQSFNQSIGHWDVTKVTDMRFMFYNAQFFNQDLTRWSVRPGRNTDCMFDNARAMHRGKKPACLR